MFLEPIRAKFGPCLVLSGYRHTLYNAAIGGARQSQHIYEDGFESVAADIRFGKGSPLSGPPKPDGSAPQPTTGRAESAGTTGPASSTATTASVQGRLVRMNMSKIAPYGKAITGALVAGLSVLLASSGDLGWDDGLSALIAFLVAGRRRLGCPEHVRANPSAADVNGARRDPLGRARCRAGRGRQRC